MEGTEDAVVSEDIYADKNDTVNRAPPTPDKQAEVAEVTIDVHEQVTFILLLD